MNTADFDRFVTLIRKLEKLYGKAVDDETMQTYWIALKEIPYEAVARRVEDHIKRAKFFPKPFELRPKDSTPVAEMDERSRKEFEIALQKNIAFWDSEIEANPGPAKWKIWAAYVSRTTLEFRGSLVYRDRMQFAREAYGRLKREYGWAPILGDIHVQQAIGICAGDTEFKAFVDSAHAFKAAA